MFTTSCKISYKYLSLANHNARIIPKIHHYSISTQD